MQIVKNHFVPGREVKRYKDVEAIVAEMIPFIDGGIKKGEYQYGFALAHCQVSEDPWAFFVVASAYVGEGKDFWPDNAIINPQMLEASDKIEVGKLEDGEPDLRQNIRTYQEGCFSFPFRKPKNIKRYYRIKVSYQVKGFFGLKTITEEIEGLRAHIFQHEFLHIIGENIYMAKKH